MFIRWHRLHMRTPSRADRCPRSGLCHSWPILDESSWISVLQGQQKSCVLIISAASWRHIAPHPPSPTRTHTHLHRHFSSKSMGASESICRSLLDERRPRQISQQNSALWHTEHFTNPLEKLVDAALLAPVTKPQDVDKYDYQVIPLMNIKL